MSAPQLQLPSGAGRELSPSTNGANGLGRSEGTTPASLAQAIAKRLACPIDRCRVRVEALFAAGLGEDEIEAFIALAEPGLPPREWAKRVNQARTGTTLVAPHAQPACHGCNDRSAPRLKNTRHGDICPQCEGEIERQAAAAATQLESDPKSWEEVHRGALEDAARRAAERQRP